MLTLQDPGLQQLAPHEEDQRGDAEAKEGLSRLPSPISSNTALPDSFPFSHAAFWEHGVML